MKKKYTNVIKLGQGGNGIVWKVKNRNGDFFAKKILKNSSDTKAYTRFRDEIKIIEKYKHPGIIELIEYNLPTKYYTKNDAFYIMPLGVPLKDYLKKIELDETFKIICNLIETLEFLHDNEITHRDLKIENILMVNGELKVSDFGLANFPKQQRVSRLNEKIGPAFTIAPEMRRISSTAEYKKADVYSLAKTIWVILTKQWLSFDGQYNKHSSISLMNHIEMMINKSHFYGVTYYFSIVILEKLLIDATHNDPEKRPSIKEFKRQFLFWLESNDNFQLRNNIEWIDALEKIFPISIPESCKWEKSIDIKNVLTIIFSEYDQLNHSFFPVSGGLDFEKIELVKLGGNDFLLINENFLLSPKSLDFEFISSFEWSYFRLELEEIKPFFNKSVYKNEETIYIDNDWNISAEKKNGAKDIYVILKGSFVIVQKVSRINKLNGSLDHYDGIHNKMTSNDYKALIMEIKEKYH